MNDVKAMLTQQEGTGPLRGGRYYLYDDKTGVEFKTGDTLIGKLTIGRGYNISDRGIAALFEEMLVNDEIANAIQDVRYHFACYDMLSRPRQLVLISMAYNLGREKLGRWPRFIAAIHLGQWDEAANQLLDSKAAREDAPARYKELARMMRGGVSEWV